MNELKYSGLAAMFLLAALAVGLMGLGVHEPLVVLLGFVPAFASGSCAAKASWS